jgi:hypothetical protein
LAVQALRMFPGRWTLLRDFGDGERPPSSHSPGPLQFLEIARAILSIEKEWELGCRRRRKGSPEHLVRVKTTSNPVSSKVRFVNHSDSNLRSSFSPAAPPRTHPSNLPSCSPCIINSLESMMPSPRGLWVLHMVPKRLNVVGLGRRSEPIFSQQRWDEHGIVVVTRVNQRIAFWDSNFFRLVLFPCHCLLISPD